MPTTPSAALPEHAPVVLACGLATLDVTQVVDALPGPDEKIVARSLDVHAGGPALNAAITAARLGCTARLASRVGTGAPAAAVASELAAEGVAVVDAAGEGWSLALSTVLVTASTGQRAVVSTNATTLGAPATLPDGVLDGVTAVLVDGHHLDLAVPLAAAAREAGIVVLLDGGSWKPGLDALLAHVDVAVLSADFHVPGVDGAGTLDAVHGHGPAVVAQSHGSGPVDVASWRPGDVTDGAAPRRARLDVAQLDPSDVVDTLGAGDVLHGALLAAVAHRGARTWEGLLDALGAATDVATASVTFPGARGWTGDAATVARLRHRVAP
jgi:sugar/nucleoside kinase (ribokinase family)